MRFRLLTGLVLVPGAAAAAQEPADTFQLAPVVVTATRLPMTADAVTATVTVLRGADLEARGIHTMLEALREVPGAAVVQTGSFGGLTSLFLRGGQSNYVKVLVDGVPVNEPGGAYDFAHLTTDNVDRIEIVRGPVSVLYGSDAVTGVVQIFTRRGQGASSATLGFQAGTYGSTDWQAGVAGGGPSGSYAVSLSRFSTDGLYPFNSQYRNTVFSALARLAPDERTDMTLTLRYGDDVFHFPTDGGGNLVDHNQFTFGRGPTAGLEVGHYFTPRVEARVLLAANETDGGFDNRPDSAGDTTGFYLFRSLDNLRRASADGRVNLYPASRTVITAGAAIEQEKERSFDVCRSEFGDCSGPPVDTARLNRAYYAQAVADVNGRLAMNAGARLEDNERFGTFLTTRVGVAYRFPGGPRLRASAGTGFREPSFFENYATGFVKGNPDLRPEHSRSWEIGFEHALWGGRATVTATYFDQRFRDLIDFTFSPPPPDSVNYFNVASARAEGLEIALRGAPASALTLGVNYTYLRTRVTKAGFDTTASATLAPGAPLLRRPSHAATVTAAYRLSGRSTVGVGVRYVGRRPDQDFSSFPFPRVTLPAYTRVDLSADWDVRQARGGVPGLAASLRIENLFDRSYNEVKNFPARRRTVFAGLELRLGS